LLAIQLYIGLNTYQINYVLNEFDLRIPNDRSSTLAKNFSISLALLLFWFRVLGPLLSETKNKLYIKSPLRSKSLISRDEIEESLPNSEKHDPIQYIGSDSKSHIGLDQNNKPLSLLDKFLAGIHLMFPGCSGMGKSATMLTMLVDRHIKGESIVFFDPKPDEYALSVLTYASKVSGKKLHIVDLEGATPLLHIFKDKTEVECERLLTAAFALGDNGSESDIYRTRDRKAARLFAPYASKHHSLKEALSEFLKDYPDAIKTNEKFILDLEELSSLTTLNATGGECLDLSEAIENGEIIYLIGSMDSARTIKAQTMCLAYVMQYCLSRSLSNASPVTIAIDEMRKYLSSTFLNSLAAARDKKARLMIAFQSMGDFYDCPKDLNPDFVKHAITTNCYMKCVFQLPDADSAKWFSELSGTRVLEERSYSYEPHEGFVEKRADISTAKEVEAPYIHQNVFLSIKPLTFILFGQGVPRLVQSSPIMIDEAEKIDINEFRKTNQNKDDHSSNNCSNEGLIDVD
ncbi:hypothetical protein A3749_16605, partial [Oleiphilus sp. HI0078]